jgi:osmoprotectant transport system permease protein
MPEQLAALIDPLPAYLGGHLRLSVAAIFTALAVSLPLGIVAAGNARIAAPALTVASTLQTIPALALLALMVPLLGGTIGFAPAFIALTLYGVLPVLRNTIVGLQGVDRTVREAARGIGMSPLQSLIRVELPLAAPTIIAGARTATVWVVGAATLATPVGATSLGNYIFAGLQTRAWDQVIFGCICSAGLAILLDQLIRALHVSAQNRKPLQALIAGAAAVVIPAGVLLAAGLANSAAPGQRFDAAQSAEAGFSDTAVVVGAKSYTEQYILTEILETYLERAGARVERRANLGSTVVFDALASGEIDVYVDYTGTLWNNILRRGAPVDRHVMYAEVSAYVLAEHGVLTLGRLGFENAYGIAVRRAFAENNELSTIADLARLERLSIASDPEFFARPEWDRVRSGYQIVGAQERSMDAAFMYGAVRDGAVDAITAYTTDGRIDAFDLLVLDDPLAALPPYDAIILLSPEAARRPAIARALAPLLGQIDGPLMRRANAVVDLERRSVREGAAVIFEALEE